MTRAWQVASAMIVTVMAGLGLGVPAASAAPVAPKSPAAPATQQSKPVPRAPHRAARFVMITCTGRAEARPRTFGLSCGDDADSLRGLRWSAWRPGRAMALGTQRVDSCMPSCARGRTVSYPVTVLLSGSERVARGSRERRYTTITLRYLGKHPGGVGRRVTGTLWP